MHTDTLSLSPYSTKSTTPRVRGKFWVISLRIFIHIYVHFIYFGLLASEPTSYSVTYSTPYKPTPKTLDLLHTLQTYFKPYRPDP